MVGNIGPRDQPGVYHGDPSSLVAMAHHQGCVSTARQNPISNPRSPEANGSFVAANHIEAGSVYFQGGLRQFPGGCFESVSV